MGMPLAGCRVNRHNHKVMFTLPCEPATSLHMGPQILASPAHEVEAVVEVERAIAPARKYTAIGNIAAVHEFLLAQVDGKLQ